MRIAISTLMVFALLFVLMPLETTAIPTEDCPRVGTYIDRVEGMIERATPMIMRSGNRRAINLLHSAIDEIHAASRAYNNDHCRAAFNHAQQAGHMIQRALRLIHRRPID